MIDLRNFLIRAKWIGKYEKVESLDLNSRCVKVVLRQVADQIDKNHSSGGLTVCRTDLTLGEYKKSRVASALRLLESVGLVKRQRNRDRSGLEKFATTFINPTLIQQSREWATANRSAKKAPSAQSREQCRELLVVQLPMAAWDHGHGQESGCAIAVAPGTNCVQGLDASYGIHTPRAHRDAATGEQRNVEGGVKESCPREFFLEESNGREVLNNFSAAQQARMKATQDFQNGKGRPL
jgi:hypothetical protein